MPDVRVSRSLLYGLVVVAAGSLLAVAFLLGRASGTAPAPAAALRPGAVAAPAASPGADAPTAPGPAPTNGSLSEPAPVAPPLAGVFVREPVTPPALSAPDPTAPAPADPERAAVSAYLATIDRIQPAEIGGSAESAANELAMALAKGDTSGLDTMIRDTEAAKRQLAAVAPPPQCAAHYRECAGSLDDGLEMLRALRDALASPDPTSALLGVSARATGLRERAEALQREDAALRRRYGLER